MASELDRFSHMQFWKASMSEPSVSDRKGYLGGSDAAVVLGISPWKSQMSLVAEKRGVAPAHVTSPDQERLFFFGNLLEQSIADAVKHYYGISSQRFLAEDGSSKFFRSALYPFMGGHVDFGLIDELGKPSRAFLECKNVRFVSNEWDQMSPDPLYEDASDRIPKYYLLQCLHYMVVLDAPYCYLAALFGGSELRLYRINSNASAQAELIEAERKFWDRFIEGDDLPVPSTADDYTIVLNAIIANAGAVPKDRRTIKLDADMREQAFRLAKLRKDTAKLEAEAKNIREDIIVLVQGNPATLVDDEGEVIGSVSSQMRSSFDEKKFKEECPKEYEKYRAYRKRTGFFIVRVSGEE